MSTGMAIYQQKDLNLCWSQLHCPVGHILKDATSKKFCGPKCGCADLAKGCSFYAGPSTNTSTTKLAAVENTA
uniref:Uncharacterized protein n=1 Tax=Ditylenchus dipsaci TaxID=166011 RepID=A0A915DM28_9BILA